jgi:hypothetical protein
MLYKFLVFLLFPVISMAECNYPIYASKKEAWFRSGLPPQTDVSYFTIASGEGKTLTEARDVAEQDLSRKQSLATGRNVQIQRLAGINNFGYNDNLEILAKIESEYHKQCRTDEHTVYLFAQVGKHPNVTLPPVPSKYFSTRVVPVWVPLMLNVTGLALGGLGYYVERKEVKKEYEYYSELKNGNKIGYDNAWKKVKDAKTKRNALYISGAAVFSVGVFLWF